MKIDGTIDLDLDCAEESAREAERSGYAGAWTEEIAHDPFFPLLLAARATETLELGTSIAVALARSPMTLANVGWDLQQCSKGRFILGLGSQIKPHITKRFSMPWSNPAARMREMISAIKHIWGAWNGHHELDFRGDYYTHTLMTPFFSPGPNPYGDPRIFLAGVGQLMTQVAGEVADGFFGHPFMSARYLREVTVPALHIGLERSGRSSGDLDVSGRAFVVTGTNAAEMAAATDGTRRQISFYGSTPAYKGVLELHGWGDLHSELNRMSKQGEWSAMPDLIDDEILHTLAIVAEPEDVGRLLVQRYGDVLDRVTFEAPYESTPERWRQVMSSIPA